MVRGSGWLICQRRLRGRVLDDLALRRPPLGPRGQYLRPIPERRLGAGKQRRVYRVEQPWRWAHRKGLSFRRSCLERGGLRPGGAPVCLGNLGTRCVRGGARGMDPALRRQRVERLYHWPARMAAGHLGKLPAGRVRRWPSRLDPPLRRRALDPSVHGCAIARPMG